MWANAQRDGRPAGHRWRPLLQHRKVWLTPTTRVPCSNSAKMRNPLKFARVTKTTGPISAASGLVRHIMGTCGGGIAAQQVSFRLSMRALVAKI